jgi:hypothetical protein
VVFVAKAHGLTENVKNGLKVAQNEIFSYLPTINPILQTT